LANKPIGKWKDSEYKAIIFLTILAPKEAHRQRKQEKIRQELRQIHQAPIGLLLLEDLSKKNCQRQVIEH
jgi:hypothetical protein